MRGEAERFDLVHVCNALLYSIVTTRSAAKQRISLLALGIGALCTVTLCIAGTNCLPLLGAEHDRKQTPDRHR